MMAKKNRGYTLTELLVAMAIASVVITFALYGINHYIATEVSMRKQVSDVEDISLVKLKMGLGVGGGNMRMYFWTGNGPVPAGGTCTGCTTPANDALLGRLMIPYPNKCRDLTSDCPNGVSIVTAMPSFNRPAPYALCMVGSDRILTLDDRAAGPLVALVSPPNASLFFVTGPAQSFSGVAALDANCLDGIRRQFNGTLPSGPFFTIPVQPAIADSVTGGACVCSEDRRNAVVEYPVRMMNVDVYSLGLLPDPVNSTANQRVYTWGMVNCEVRNQGSSLQLNCNRGADFMMKNVLYVEVDQIYRVYNVTEPGMWYSLNPTPDPRFCKPGACRAISVPAALKVKLASESLTQLNYTTFSLIKQDVLKKMRFQVLQKNDKVQTAEIQF